MKKIALVKTDIDSGIGYVVNFFQRHYKEADIDLYSFDQKEEEIPGIRGVILKNMMEGLSKVKGEYDCAVLVYNKLYSLRALAGLIYVWRLKAARKQVRTLLGYHSDLNAYFLLRQMVKGMISIVCVFLYVLIIPPLYLAGKLFRRAGR